MTLRLGTNKVSPMVRAIGMNGVVQNKSVGIPSCSSWTASWQLHDVQEPQSPLPVKTRSTLFKR